MTMRGALAVLRSWATLKRVGSSAAGIGGDGMIEVGGTFVGVAVP